VAERPASGDGGQDPGATGEPAGNQPGGSRPLPRGLSATAASGTAAVVGGAGIRSCSPAPKTGPQAGACGATGVQRSSLVADGAARVVLGVRLRPGGT